MNRVVRVFNYRVVPYRTAWDWQKALVAKKMQSPEYNNIILMLEHPNVYTMGKAANPEFLRFEKEHEIYYIERGGQVTHHCPGQLVVYPILNLKHDGFMPDLHFYLRQLEDVVIRILNFYDLEGRRDEEYTGVWVGNCKVCAIGLTARKWITFHGIGLNVNCDLKGFEEIVPCGITDPTRSVSSIANLVRDGRKVCMDDVKYLFAKEFENVFNVELEFCEGKTSPLD
jgi:lipoyl(octanoyl) transferase